MPRCRRWRDIPTAMNRRRGFFRLYAVLSVIWVIGVLVATPTERSKFWRPASPKAAAGRDREYRIGDTVYHFPADVSEERVWNILREKDIVVETTSDGVRVVSSTSQDDGQGAGPKLLGLAKCAVIPPATAYLALFVIVPWVYRGFRPGTRT